MTINGTALQFIPRRGGRSGKFKEEIGSITIEGNSSKTILLNGYKATITATNQRNGYSYKVGGEEGKAVDIFVNDNPIAAREMTLQPEDKLYATVKEAGYTKLHFTANPEKF